MMKITKLLGYKIYGVQTQQLLQEKDELRQILSPVTICMNKTLLYTRATVKPFTALKIILIYMKKESLNMYTRIGVKSDLKN